MTLIEEVRNAIKNNKIDPIFSSTDMKAAGISDLHHNISNYVKKNKGANNQKVLVSRVIEGTQYYAFDERLFDD